MEEKTEAKPPVPTAEEPAKDSPENTAEETAKAGSGDPDPGQDAGKEINYQQYIAKSSTHGACAGILLILSIIAAFILGGWWWLAPAAAFGILLYLILRHAKMISAMKAQDPEKYEQEHVKFEQENEKRIQESEKRIQSLPSFPLMLLMLAMAIICLLFPLTILPGIVFGFLTIRSCLIRNRIGAHVCSERDLPRLEKAGELNVLILDCFNWAHNILCRCRTYSYPIAFFVFSIMLFVFLNTGFNILELLLLFGALTMPVALSNALYADRPFANFAARLFVVEFSTLVTVIIPAIPLMLLVLPDLMLSKSLGDKVESNLSSFPFARAILDVCDLKFHWILLFALVLFLIGVFLAFPPCCFFWRKKARDVSLVQFHFIRNQKALFSAGKPFFIDYKQIPCSRALGWSVPMAIFSILHTIVTLLVIGLAVIICLYS